MSDKTIEAMRARAKTRAAQVKAAPEVKVAAKKPSVAKAEPPVADPPDTA